MPVWPACRYFDTAQRSLRAAGIDVVPYTEVRIEPTDESFGRAAAFASEADPDGYVSVGGGSVIDTAKAANLYASYPADFLSYVNPPVGEGSADRASEATYRLPDDLGHRQRGDRYGHLRPAVDDGQTGIASPALRPTEALVDPDAPTPCRPSRRLFRARCCLTHWNRSLRGPLSAAPSRAAPGQGR